MFHVVAQNIHKDYRLYARPIDRLIEAITRKPRHHLFSVLKGISFTLTRNQSLGIIGPNGAGKSTLLKILSGTVTPTSGSVETTGRVAALLELGAGFHLEFSGRQNIFLNASLLGLSPEEIASKEDEIIAFSELGEFIDRPVKTYSSGMYIRLAFAIATSVDPDILIIDEALAVGDMAFQRKCIDRMNRFREEGKTMIFCSHSMYHVKELCEKAIWLNQGKVRRMGQSDDVVARYEEFSDSHKAQNSNEPEQPEQVSDRKDCRIIEIGMETTDGRSIGTITPFSDVIIKMEVEVLEDHFKPQFGFAFVMADETICSTCLTHHDGISCGPYRAGEKIVVRLHAKELPFREGTYRLTGGVSDEKGLLWYESKHLWPVKVTANQGFGFVTFRREWHIEKET